MNYKLPFLCLILSLVFHFSYCQELDHDLILLKNGNEIKAKVKEVDENVIRYLKINNLNGPIYTSTIKEISMIRYANGESDVFSGRDYRNSKFMDGRNIFTAHLISMMPGFSYERLSSTGRIGAEIGMHYRLYDFNYNIEPRLLRTAMKVYLGKPSKIDFFFGPAFEIGNTVLNYNYWKHYTITTADLKYKFEQSGSGTINAVCFSYGLVSGLNFNVSPNFILGLEGQLGSIYVDKFDHSFLFGSAGLKLGYRF